MVQAGTIEQASATAGPLRVTVLQGLLKPAVDRAARLAGHKAPYPITTALLLEAEGEVLTVTATDLEMTVIAQVAAKVEQAGRVAVPAQLLRDFLAALPNDRVELEMDGARLRLRCARSSIAIRTFPAEDFPALVPVRDDATTLTVDSQQLRRALSRTVIAVEDARGGRPVLQGVYLERTPEGLILSGANGFMLATVAVPYQGELEAREGAQAAWILPAPLVAELVSLLGSESEPVTLTLDSQRLALSARRTVLQGLLTQGTYPNYRLLIPKAHDSTATLALEALGRAVQTACLFRDSKDQGTTVRLWSEPAQLDGVATLSVAAREEQDGEGHTALDTVLEGPPFKIAFSGTQLRTVLKALESGSLTLATTTPNSPAVLRPVGEDGAMFVLMPMFVKD